MTREELELLKGLIETWCGQDASEGENCKQCHAYADWYKQEPHKLDCTYVQAIAIIERELAVLEAGKTAVCCTICWCPEESCGCGMLVGI